MFPKLKSLNFDPSDMCWQRISFDDLLQSVFSSTLSELHIQVFYMDDCLHLLDDCFNQLRVFNVRVSSSCSTLTRNKNEVYFQKFEFH